MASHSPLRSLLQCDYSSRRTVERFRGPGSRVPAGPLMTDYKALWRQRTREWAKNLLGGRCVLCGTTEDLQFDHIDAATKTIDVSAAIRDGWSRRRIGVELEKCQLLCSYHNGEKSTILGEHAGGKNKIIDPQHGTSVMYGRQKCRCAVCRLWKRQHRAGLVDSNNNTRM